MLAYILSANGICALLTALGLLVVTVAIHTLGLDALLRVMIRAHALNISGFHRVTPWVFGMACWLMLVHLIEISVWGLFYVWQGCLPDAETALYFSGITYTTVGYGDLVLLKPWRMLAPLEALTGILMVGLSTGFFFAAVTRWISNWMRTQTASEHHAAAQSNKNTPPSKEKFSLPNEEPDNTQQ